eukprot:gene10204-13728_t
MSFKASSSVSSEITFFRDKDEVYQCIFNLCNISIVADVYNKDFTALSRLLGPYQEQPLLLSPYLPEMLQPLLLKLVTTCEKIITKSTPTLLSVFHAICKVLQLICRIRGHKHVVKLFPHEVYHLEICLKLLKSQDKNDCDNWESRYIQLLWLGVLCLIPFDICSMDSSITVVGNSVINDIQSNNNGVTLVGDIIALCTVYLCDSGPTREAASISLAALLTRPDMETLHLDRFVVWTEDILEKWISKVDEQRLLSSETFVVIGALQCLAQILKIGHRQRILPHANKILSAVVLLSESVNNQTMTRKLVMKLFQRIGMNFLPPRIADWRYQRGQRALGNALASLKHNSVNVSSAADSIDKKPEQDEAEVEYRNELEIIIEKLLGSLGDKDTIVRWSAAKGVGRITMRLSKEFADDIIVAVLDQFFDSESDSNWHGGCLAIAELARRGLLLPDRLSEVIPYIVKAMLFDVVRGQHSVGAHVRDAACYVCWSFSRAYSPLIMKPYIKSLSASMLITTVFDREVNCRRAASAAFQENVGRQGNESFPNGIEIITAANYFSLGSRKLSYMSISHTISTYDEDIRIALVIHLSTIKLFHWDREIRLLASKSLPKLLLINTESSLLVDVIQDLIKCCLSPALTIRHGSIIGIAEIILALFLTNKSNILSEIIIKSIIDIVPAIEKGRLYRGRGSELTRCASCLLIESIAKCNITLNNKIKVTLLESLNEHMKQPHEDIQQSAASALRQFLYSYFNELNLSSPISQLITQEGGVIGMTEKDPAAGDNNPSESLQKLTVLKYMNGLVKEQNVAITRGYAMALGVLPIKLANFPPNRLNEIFSSLHTASSVTTLISGEPDALTRCNAIQSAIELTEKSLFLHDYSHNNCDYYQIQTFKSCLELLYRASTDYCIDKRGDTGSWSRIVALKGFLRLVSAVTMRSTDQSTNNSINNNIDSIVGKYLYTSYGCGKVLPTDNIDNNKNDLASQSFSDQIFRVQYLKDSIGGQQIINNQSNYMFDNKVDVSTLIIYNKNKPLPIITTMSLELRESLSITLLSSEELGRMVSIMLKQLAEKLDAVREVAGSMLLNLISMDIDIDIPDKDNSELYYYPILSGLVISIGGLTETIATASTQALLKYLMKSENVNKIHFFSEGIINIFSEFSKQDRVILPLLKSLEIFIRKGIFDNNNNINNNNMASFQFVFFCDVINKVTFEMKGSTNLQKIKLSLDIMALIVMVPYWKTKKNGLLLLLNALGHKYPRIRKYAAELLYLFFLSCSGAMNYIKKSMEDSELTDNNWIGRLIESDNSNNNDYFLFQNNEDAEKVLFILSTSNWDSSDRMLVIGNRCDVMNLTGFIINKEIESRKENTIKSSKQNQSNKTMDELDSYEALVKDSGY